MVGYPYHALKMESGKKVFFFSIFGPIKDDLILTREELGTMSRPPNQWNWLCFCICPDYSVHIREDTKSVGERFYVEGGNKMMEVLNQLSESLSRHPGGMIRQEGLHLYFLVPNSNTLSTTAVQVGTIIGGEVVN